jgi:hypothetical protein
MNWMKIKILLSAHRVYRRVLGESRNKPQTFLYTQLTGFYKRDEVCLLRGTNWMFKSLIFVLKGKEESTPLRKEMQSCSVFQKTEPK